MYVHQGLAFTEHKKKSKQKMLFISWGRAPLEGGAIDLVTPVGSFYHGSLVPVNWLLSRGC